MGNAPPSAVSRDVRRMCGELTAFLARVPSYVLGVRYVYYALGENDIAITYAPMLRESWRAAVDDDGNVFYFDADAARPVRYNAAPPVVDFLILEQKRMPRGWVVRYNARMGCVEYDHDGATRYTPPRGNGVFETRRITRALLLRHHAAMAELMRIVPEDAPDGPECPICMDRACTAALACGHGFCAACLADWTRAHADCPLCHAPIADGWLESHCPHSFLAVAKKALAIICSSA